MARPILVSVTWNLASRVATMWSHNSAVARAWPRQYPWTAAMTGFQWSHSRNASRSVVRPAVDPSSMERWRRALTSPPLEKDRPRPDRMAMSAVSSPSRRRSAVLSAWRSSSRKALCFSPRSKLMWAMRSRTA